MAVVGRVNGKENQGKEKVVTALVASFRKFFGLFHKRRKEHRKSSDVSPSSNSIGGNQSASAL